VGADALVVDLQRPNEDEYGLRIIEDLRADEETRAIPIIFLTARADLRDRVRGMDAGGLDYVTKPFNPVELASLVREVVDAVARGEREQLRTERIAELRSLFETA
jgi:DNA-binding response OmpR family regulator